MQFVPMIADQENKGVFIMTIPLKSGNDLPHLIIGEKQAVVVVGNLFSHLGYVRIVRRYRDFIQRGYLLGATTGLSSGNLNLPKEWLSFGTTGPF